MVGTQIIFHKYVHGLEFDLFELIFSKNIFVLALIHIFIHIWFILTLYILLEILCFSLTGLCSEN